MPRNVLVTITLAAAASGLLACAGAQPLRNDAGVCPESRTLMCVTQVECVEDAARGCRVCSCGTASTPLRRAPAPDQRDAVRPVPPTAPPVRPD